MGYQSDEMGIVSHREGYSAFVILMRYYTFQGIPLIKNQWQSQEFIFENWRSRANIIIIKFWKNFTYTFLITMPFLIVTYQNLQCGCSIYQLDPFNSPYSQDFQLTQVAKK